MTVSVTFDVVGHPATGSTTNLAAITAATDQYNDLTPPSNSSASVGITAPSVSVDKRLATGQSAVVSAGDTVSFDIGVTNSGDTTLTAIALRDTFDAGVFEFVSATPAADSTTPSGTVVWSNLVDHFGVLEPSETETVTITLRGRRAAAGSIDTAAVTSATDINTDSALLDSDTAAATVVEPALAISKTADKTLLGPGETATYEIAVTNSGTGPAHELVVRDLVPAALWPVMLDRVELDGVDLTAGADYVWSVPGLLQPEIALLVPVPSGSVVRIVYTAQLAGGTAAGSTLENTASARTSSLPGVDPNENSYGPVTDAWSITSQAPALALVKSVVGDTELQRGQDGTYRVVVTNTGDAPAYSVMVTDTLPAGLDYVAGTSSASWSGGGSSAADPVVTGSELGWTFAGAAYLLPRESLTLEFSARVALDAALGTKTNTAVATGFDGGGWQLPPASGTSTCW